MLLTLCKMRYITNLNLPFISILCTSLSGKNSLTETHDRNYYNVLIDKRHASKNFIIMKNQLYS